MSTFTHSINAEQFESEVLQAELPVVVDFWAQWCSPCRSLKPVFEALAEEFSGKVKFVKIDLEAHPDNGQIASQYRVRGIPTLLGFKAGKEVSYLVGFAGEEGTRQFVESLL